LTIYAQLVKDLESRQKLLRADKNIHTYFMKDLDPKELLSMSIAQVFKGAESKVTLVDLVVSLGHRIRQKLNLPRDTVAACHAGWFVFVSYLENKICTFYLKKKRKKGKTSKYQSYHISLQNKEAMRELWEEVFESSQYIELFPLKSPPADWGSGMHALGYPMIRKGDSFLLSQISKDEDDFILNVLNKLGKTAWSVNEDVLAVYNHYLKDPSGPFRMYREKDEAKIQSLRIEAETIGMIANKFVGTPYYHLWSFDFRGRVYPLTSFFHPQGSDNAKGLINFAETKEFGEDGEYWFKVHTANCFGVDKLTLDERVEFVTKNWDKFKAYAEDPYNYKEWMDAEKPWSFLACCFEIKKIAAHQGTIKTYPSNLPIFVDGSCSGLQHLSALSKDEVIAEEVNVLPTEKPGDVYSLIAHEVWKKLRVLHENTPEKYKDRLKEVLAKEEYFRTKLKESEDKPEANALVYSEYKEWLNQARGLREAVFPEYWLAIDDPKIQRKTVKRCVMVLGYGGTKYGFSQFLQEDLDDISEYLDKRSSLHCALMGSLIYDICFEALEGPGRMLRFFEKIGEISNQKGEFLSWLTPTGFPVIQNYPKAATKRTKLQYGNKTLNVIVEAWEFSTIQESAQRQATAPNFVHSMDASHLQLILTYSDFPVAAIHDSIGCHAGNMAEAYGVIRETFISLYKTDPLRDFMNQINCKEKMKLGKLNLDEVRDSIYFFS
jgi:DNA-directed RNA polymerase